MKNKITLKDEKWVWPIIDENSWKNQNELKDLYPKKFELEFILKKKFWQTTPKIIDINFKKILNETSKIKLENKYNKLNMFKKPFINII